jgi:hypothetical protein
MLVFVFVILVGAVAPAVEEGRVVSLEESHPPNDVEGEESANGAQMGLFVE